MTEDRLDRIRSRFLPLFADVRSNALRHEQERSLPYDEVRALAAAGFGALRLPRSEGGEGLSLAEFFALFTELAAADSNQPQIWRNHVAFVEDRLQPEPQDRNRLWRKHIADGAFVGGAWSERGNKTFADSSTTVEREGGDWVLNGVKYYSTGSNFADWISVAAKRDGDEGGIVAIVATADPGVEVEDDWTGFGQVTTGSGTTRFTGVAVDDEAIYPFTERAAYQEAVYQLVHLSTLAGIGRAAHRDLVDEVRGRTRNYPHGLSPVARDDAQLQAVVGRVSAYAASAEASVQRAAGFLDRAAAAAVAGRPEDEVTRLVHEAANAVYEAQLTVTEEVLAATTLLFDALGSSALDRSLSLDRHWRNARTVTSHNPRVYKERLVGAWHLNGTAPEVFGTAAKAADAPEVKQPAVASV